MSMTRLSLFLALIGVLVGGTAQASEANIRKTFETKVSGAKVESVSKTPMPGVFEVIADGHIFYVDEKVDFVMRGTLFDARTSELRNLTKTREAQIAAQILRKSTDNAIKRVRGSGKRVIYTFEDPNCGFCRRQQAELMKLNDVTIYTFLWPILAADSVEKSRAVWCSKDRAKAWDDLMSNGVLPKGDNNCPTPFDRNVELARRFGAQGTPAIYLSDGSNVGGYLAADKLEAALRSVDAR